MEREVSTFEVLMDDGRELKAQVDQRDYAAWEAAEENVVALGGGHTGGRHTASRYMVWHALKRAGEVNASFSRFNSRDCVQVMLVASSIPDANEGEEETEQQDPTRG